MFFSAIQRSSTFQPSLAKNNHLLLFPTFELKKLENKLKGVSIERPTIGDTFLKQLEKNILTVFRQFRVKRCEWKLLRLLQNNSLLILGCGRFWLSWPGVLSSNPAVSLARGHKNKPIMCLGPAHQNISRITIWQFYNFVPLLGSQDEFCFANFQA